MRSIDRFLPGEDFDETLQMDTNSEGKLWLRWLPSPKAAALLLAAVVLLAVGVGRVVIGEAENNESYDSTPVSAASLPVTDVAAPQVEPQSTKTGSTSEVTVHVVGEVAKPGVYQLPGGSRVHEAIDTAGGATENAHLELINLAAQISDGQQIVVPDSQTAAGAAAVTTTATGSGIGADGKVSINLASASELEKLDGIGPSLAERIVAYRESNGPFSSIESLTEVPGIGQKILARFSSEITL